MASCCCPQYSSARIKKTIDKIISWVNKFRDILSDGDKGDITLSGSGTVWTIDSGAVTSEKIANDTIVNDDINANAAISGTKISPNFGTQNIITTGAIGAGTLSPGYKIDSVTNVNSASGTRAVNQNAGSNAHTVLQIGNDTNSAAAALRLNSSTNTIFGGANSLSVINGLNAPLLLATNGAEKVRLEAGGNLGIGTTSPSSKLHINGDVTVSSATTANTATAGSETLPANPVGFLVISINGTSRKIPYYAT